MKIKILKTTVADSRFVKAGEVIDVPESEARLLVGIGKAEYVSGTEQVEAPVQIEKPLDTETAEAIVETKLRKPRKQK